MKYRVWCSWLSWALPLHVEFRPKHTATVADPLAQRRIFFVQLGPINFVVASA